MADPRLDAPAAAAASSGPAAGSRDAPAAAAASSGPLRVGVVGLDHYHVTGWVETVEGFADGLRIVALHDRDPERGRALAPRYTDPSLRPGLGQAYRGLPFETDLGALIERHALDVALVLLPNRDAPAAIERLAGAGIHMLVDKPAARTADEARPAVAAARAAGVRLATGLTRRYQPAWQAARRAVATGSLGRIVAVEAVFAAADVHVRGLANPIFDPDGAGGGILSWLGIHDLDATLWLTGERVDEVSAIAGRVGDPALLVEDVVSVALRLSGGGVATLHQSYALPARGYRGGFALRGTKASLEIGLDDSIVTLRPSSDAAGAGLATERATYAEPPAPGYGVSGRAAVADLIASIRDGREPLTSGEDLVRALELVDAAYLSIATGRRVALGSA